MVETCNDYKNFAGCAHTFCFAVLLFPLIKTVPVSTIGFMFQYAEGKKQECEEAMVD